MQATTRNQARAEWALHSLGPVLVIILDCHFSMSGHVGLWQEGGGIKSLNYPEQNSWNTVNVKTVIYHSIRRRTIMTNLSGHLRLREVWKASRGPWTLRWNRQSSRRDVGDALDWLKSRF